LHSCVCPKRARNRELLLLGIPPATERERTSPEEVFRQPEIS
jgi:hypothetical protein